MRYQHTQGVSEEIRRVDLPQNAQGRAKRNVIWVSNLDSTCEIHWLEGGKVSIRSWNQIYEGSLNCNYKGQASRANEEHSVGNWAGILWLT